MAAWIKMSLGVELGLDPSDFYYYYFGRQQFV